MNTHADRGPAVAREITARLAALDPQQLEVIDDSAKHVGHAGARPWGGTHWRVSILSPRFAGLGTVARHRMVYAALGDLMQDPIHALAISARAPDDPGAVPRSNAGAAPRSDPGEHRS